MGFALRCFCFSLETGLFLGGLLDWGRLPFDGPMACSLVVLLDGWGLVVRGFTLLVWFVFGLI